MENSQENNLNRLTMFIGANNDTGNVEVAKVESVLDKHFDGYNYLHSSGRWQGMNEKSLNVFIATSEPIKKIKSVVQELKKILIQDSIMVEYNNEVYFL